MLILQLRLELGVVKPSFLLLTKVVCYVSVHGSFMVLVFVFARSLNSFFFFFFCRFSRPS